MSDTWMRPSQCAEESGYSTERVRYWIRKRLLRAYPKGSHWKVRRTDWLAFAEHRQITLIGHPQ